MLSTGWFQERIRALFHTRIKMNSSKGLIEYWYSCEIVTLVKYRKWIWDDASTCTLLKMTRHHTNTNTIQTSPWCISIMVSKIKSPWNVSVRKSCKNKCNGRSSVEQSVNSAAILRYDVRNSHIRIRLTYKCVLSFGMYSLYTVFVVVVLANWHVPVEWSYIIMHGINTLQYNWWHRLSGWDLS